MSTSTVPAVRAALVDRFTALLTTAGDPSRVLYGHPGQDIPRRFVAVSSTEDGLSREQRTLPLRQASSRTEEYGLRVIVWAFTGSQTPEAQREVVEQAWATFDALDNGLRADVTVGGVVTSALLTRAVDDDYVLAEGRAAQIAATVTVTVNRA